MAGSRTEVVWMMTAGIEPFAAWPPAAVASVLASLGAAALAFVGVALGTVWAVVRWRRDVAREERDRGWSRFVWTIDQLCSQDVGRAEIGRLGVIAMYDMQLLCDEDEEIGSLILEMITGRSRS